MNKTIGISGYIALIIAAPFLDIPFLGLLAIPIFLTGTILLTVFFTKLIPEKFEFSFFYSAIVIIGVLTICGVLGYSSVQFNAYLVSVNRDEALLYSPLNKIIIIEAISILSSLLVFLMIRKSVKLDKSTLIYYWIPTLLLIPVAIFLIKILEMIGAPLSA